jgi:putative membrane protein
MNSLRILTFLCFLISTSFSAQIAEKDLKFLEAAFDSGLMEIRLAEMAKLYAVTPELKTSAEKILKDHQTANGQMQKIAAGKSVVLPANVSKSLQKNIDKLASKKGKDFDLLYIDMVMKDHQEQGVKFEAEAFKGTDAEIKAWALQRWPVLGVNELEAESCIKKVR